ncbi:MAG: DUF1015 domain-containing protein [Bacteroidetes bacterium]|nr:DUF1015 domain-containing protein [Bacteroidota bacterium]
MATLHPFKALRPNPDHVRDVACVPYDVIDSDEARQLAEGNPHSFLHVIRPEIDLPVGTSEYDDRVYEIGAANLKALADSSYYVTERAPGLYVYRLVMDGRSQTGIFGCVSVADYDNDVILKHEKTRPSKEDDRTKHIVTQRAHAEPVMLTFRDADDVAAIVQRASDGEPLYDFEAPDSVRHTIWKVDETSELVDAFASVERLYVADGHHRCKAASRAAHELGGRPSDEVSFFPAVLFPMSEVAILPYNRIIYALPGSTDSFKQELTKRFGVVAGPATPDQPGRVSVYLSGEWLLLDLPESAMPGEVASLDVARLAEFVLEPMLGIGDPRTDPNIDFVGGIRGTGELERLVDSGKAALAISMYPTSVEELVTVSDAGMLMPPKSTWFEPKLRSGMLVHRF